VRRRAALAAAPRRDAADALAALLADGDDSVVETACFAWGERPSVPGGVVSQLARIATDHDDHLCREAAVAALGAIGDAAGLPAVLAGCRDRHNVRRRAVLALAAFDGREVTAELRRLTSDRDLQVRQAAEELLAIEEGADLGPDPSDG
jgi:HEAT repeat protein